MASSAVNSVQQVGKLLGEEAKFLYNIQRKIESLQTELQWMECFLEDADSRQHKNKLVGKWIAQITEFAHEDEDLVERYLYHVPLRQDNGIWNTIKWFSNLLCACHAYKLHCFGSEIDDLIIKIAELNSRLKRYGVELSNPTENKVYSAMKREGRLTYSHIEGGVDGLERDVKEVVDKLTKTEVKVVSIAGVDGLGKITIANKVFQDKDIKEHFRNNCAWVDMSEEFCRKIVFEDILSGLDEGARNNIKDLTEGELPQKIDKLLQEKECFVVLDDLRYEEDWDDLKPALASIQSSRSKILLTTPNRGLLQHVDSNGYSYPLEHLNDDDSWKLFLLRAFPQRKRAGNEEATLSAVSSGTSKNVVTTTFEAEKIKRMEELGKEMLKHCGGHPLAIAALGEILSTKRTSVEWEQVKNDISTYLMTDICDGSETGEISSVLELSYDALPYYLKSCFLYLASFPQGYEISAKRLYCLWEAEGNLQIPNRGDTNVVNYSDMGETYLLALIQRSMVQAGRRSKSGKIKTCKVHGLIRDLCIKKCKEASFLNIVQDVITERKKLRRWALHLKGKGLDLACFPQQGKKGAFIRSLLAFQWKGSQVSYFGRNEFLNMVKCFPMVRVLDLEDALIDIKVLKVGHLIHLRYLNVRRAQVAKLASCIGDLKFLVTLDLRVNDTIELPNKFRGMKSLRHLYLPRQFSVKQFSVKYQEKLSFVALPIETLKNFCQVKCEMKDLLSMAASLRDFSMNEEPVIDKDLKVLAKLRLLSSVRLQIAMGAIDENPTIVRSVFKGSRCFIELYLQGEKAKAYPNLVNAMASGTQVFPHNLALLDIKFMLSREVLLELEKLPHLQELRLHQVDVGNKITFSASSFPHLDTLHFFQCDLEKWEIGDGALPNLQHLKLVGCQQLKELREGLTNLVDIHCNPCITRFKKYNTCPFFRPC